MKPDAVARGLVGEILGRFEKRGMKILQLRAQTMTKAKAEEFYSVHKERPFFRELVVFFEIALLLAVGILLRRRWIVAGALAVVGLEAIRGMIDVVNRLPNWALFGGSGAILLTAGFVLLLKREAWNAWSRRAYAWWARL